MQSPRQRWLSWLDAQPFVVAAVALGALFGLLLWLAFAVMNLGDWSASGLLASTLIGVALYGPFVIARRRRARRR